MNGIVHKRNVCPQAEMEGLYICVTERINHDAPSLSQVVGYRRLVLYDSNSTSQVQEGADKIKWVVSALKYDTSFRDCVRKMLELTKKPEPILLRDQVACASNMQCQE